MLVVAAADNEEKEEKEEKNETNWIASNKNSTEMANSRKLRCTVVRSSARLWWKMHVKIDFITNNISDFPCAARSTFSSCHMNFSLKSFTILFKVMTRKINCNYFVLFNVKSYLFLGELGTSPFRTHRKKEQTKYTKQI